MILKPSPDQILIEEDAFKYEGLIEIPDKAKRRPTTGTIREIGANITLYKKGQHVLFAQFSGTGIKLKNQPHYRVCTEAEILLTIEGDAEVEEVSA